MKKRTVISKVLVLSLLVFMFTSLFLTTVYGEPVKEISSSASISGGMIDLGSGNTGKLIVQFDIATLAIPQDSFVGFCDSSASPKSESDFPIAFKLTEDTVMAALSKNDYVFSEERFVSYSGDGQYYTVRMEVDLAAKLYDVYVYPPGIEPVLIAEKCSFRDGVAIDDIGKACVYSTDGKSPKEGLFKIRNLMVIPYEPAYGEWRAANDPAKATYDLGSGNTGVVTTEFDVTFYAHGGGILYLGSDQEPNGWSAPVIVNIGDGFFQARNGDSYQRLADVSYQLGKKNHVKVVIDLNNKTYDVFVDGIQIADDFVYRTGFDMNDVGKVFLLSVLGINKADDAFSVTNHTVNGVPSVPPTPEPTSAPATPAPTTSTSTETPAAPANPKTNDMSAIYMAAAAVVAAGAAGAGITIFRKKK